MGSNSELRNPIFWAFVSFLGGMIVGAIGWIKNEAIEEKVTHGSTFMIILGVAMIVFGLVFFFTWGNRK